MRFKKGTSVEVFSKKEVPTGAWLCADIISGNGHMYSVQYKHLSNSAEPVVERVPRKAIRPCPSPVEGPNNWVPGDIIEAFHNFSWKMARIVNIVDGERFLVRILGLSKGCFHKSHLRVRQCWHDGKWSVIGKGLEIAKAKKRVGDDRFPVEKYTELKTPRVISTGTMKRRTPLGSHDLEAYPIAARKKRILEKGSSRQKIYHAHWSPTSQKVDSVVYPDVVLGANHMNSSFNVATAEFSVLDTCRKRDGNVIDYTSVDTDSCASSCGSCNSMGNNAPNFPIRYSPQNENNMEDYVSDAESSCGEKLEKEECSPYSGKQSGLDFRRSGLDTYRFALEDLYSLGPLSWEDEAKLTNLRHVLHISDDEHLGMLRNLISANRMVVVS